MMWIVLLLVTVFASRVYTEDSDYADAVLKCSQFYVPFKFHHGLPESAKELDAVCRQQEYFYNCLESTIQNFGYSSPTVFEPKHRIAHLCSVDSPYRQRYLELAPCFNSKDTTVCMSQTAIASLRRLQDSPSKCSIRKAVVKCILNRLHQCSPDSETMFNFVLKSSITDKQNCNTLGSEVLFPHIDNEREYTEIMVDNGGFFQKVNDIPAKHEYGFLNDGTILDLSSNETISEGFPEQKVPDETEYVNHRSRLLNLDELVARDDHARKLLDRLGDIHVEQEETEISYEAGLRERILERIGDIYEEHKNNIIDLMQYAVSEETENFSEKESDKENTPDFIAEKEDASEGKFHRSLLDRIGDIPIEHENNRVTSESMYLTPKENPEISIDSNDGGHFDVENMLPNLENEGKIELHNGLLKRIGEISTEFEDLREISDSLLNHDVSEKATEETEEFGESGLLYLSFGDLFNFDGLETQTSGMRNDVSTYNHRDGRLSIYWRQPGFVPLENMTCGHIKESDGVDTFHCKIEPRRKDPLCLHSVKLGSTLLNPEVIDPELGIKLYETFPTSPYAFQNWINASVEESTCHFCSKSQARLKETEGVSNFEAFPFTQSLLYRMGDVTGDDVTESDSDMENEEVTESTCTNFEPNGDQNDELPRGAEVTRNDIIRRELSRLFPTDIRFSGASNFRFSGTGSIDMFWKNKQGSSIQNISCGRVNECHPDAKGVFKCMVSPRNSDIFVDQCESAPSNTRSDSRRNRWMDEFVNLDEFLRSSTDDDYSITPCDTCSSVDSDDYRMYFESSDIESRPPSETSRDMGNPDAYEAITTGRPFAVETTDNVNMGTVPSRETTRDMDHPDTCEALATSLAPEVKDNSDKIFENYISDHTATTDNPNTIFVESSEDNAVAGNIAAVENECSTTQPEM